MFEAYKVGVTLQLNNLVSPILFEIGRDFAKLDGIVLSLQKNLKSIGANAIGIRAVARAGDASAIALERANVQAAVLERNLVAIRAAGAATAGAGLLPIVNPGRGRGGGARGGYGQHAGLHGGNVHMGPNGVGMGTIGYSLGGGPLLAGVAAGAGVLYMEKAMYESAKDFQTEVARFSALGLGDKLNADAVKFVTGMKTYGTNMSQNMALFRDAQTIFRDSGSLEHAEMVTPVLSKMLLSQHVLFGENGGDRMSKFMDMLKVIELRKGLSSPSEFLKQADMVQQVLATSGGRVDATQYLNAMKTGGTALASQSNEALYYGAEPLIQEVGGSRFGTGMQTMYNRLMLGTGVSNTSASEMLRIGLLDPKKIELNKLGGFKRYKSGQNALTGSDIFQKDFIKFYTDVLLPLYAKAGITKEEDILRENALIGGRTPANAVWNPLQRQLPIILKSLETTKKAATIDQAAKIAKGTAEGAEEEFVAAWTDFKTQFGQSILPKITAMLRTGSEMFRGLNAFYGRNKESVDAVGTLITPGGVPSTGIDWGKKLIDILFGSGSNSLETVRGSGAADARHVKGDVYLDGEKVGKHVTRHMSEEGHLPRYNNRTQDVRATPFPHG